MQFILSGRQFRKRADRSIQLSTRVFMLPLIPMHPTLSYVNNYLGSVFEEVLCLIVIIPEGQLLPHDLPGVHPRAPFAVDIDLHIK